jgi:lipopolysaccharide transport system permease protein
MTAYLRTLLSHRDLLYFLALREIKAKYKQTVLGVSWAVLQPLATVTVFTVVFSLFARLPSDGIPYPVFSYCALLPWNFFAGILGRGAGMLLGNTVLIKKVYFPREIIILAVMLAALVDFLIGALLLAALLWYFHVSVTLYALYALPLFVLQFCFLLGLVLVLSPLNCFYRDVVHVMPLLLQVWMFLTPIIYPLSVVPERFRPLYSLNPMAGIIDNYRKVLVQGVPPDFGSVAIGFLAAAVVLAGGFIYFKRVEFRLADVM